MERSTILSRKQERAFWEFVKNDKHFSRYYEGIYILFKTGLRISEFVGLTTQDIDLKDRTLNVNHQLQRTRTMGYVIEDTKTNAGTRILPMTADGHYALGKILSAYLPEV